jgi:hypothetical protein
MKKLVLLLVMLFTVSLITANGKPDRVKKSIKRSELKEVKSTVVPWFWNVNKSQKNEIRLAKKKLKLQHKIEKKNLKLKLSK